MNDILNLNPKRVFYYFNEICKIPHPSKKEEKIVAWLLETGKVLGLETKRDKIGNVLISKPATKGKENVTPVIFQSHVDMVCEKNNDTKFDFDKDPIQPYVDGEWLKAKGTTLGADDGIGVAIQLALLEANDIEHGPMECLFTVDEETGLTGAFNLEAGFMKGKMLLNLDSEDEGEFFIGCAGGKDTQAILDLEWEDKVPKDFIAYNIYVKGLQGGHSGDDINKGRGNAVKLLNRILWNAYQDLDLFIAEMDAGNLRNAIAREGNVHIIIPKENKKAFEKYLQEMDKTYKEELHVTDPGVTVTFEEAKMPKKILNELLQIDLMNALYVCPHGVLAMSQDIPGFVETSTNLASVKFKDGKILISTSQRSSVESKKQDAVDMVSSTFYTIGADDVKIGDGYPGWEPNPNSEVLKVLTQAYRNLFKKEPEAKAIHAGLECGLFSEKYPGLDMVSYGPTLRGVHSPEEKLKIDTVQQVWDLTVEFLKILK
ncbi:MAG: aminoacyl-histidine dipeptidase [Bacteroidetes bacterium]|nr:aminoacyl-histidine dipeptidase [Bacteroidota bacterium]MCL2303109.1 aminoacyl-histidine dipeptidase [Lentimicrobiaceae bacterium]